MKHNDNLVSELKEDWYIKLTKEIEKERKERPFYYKVYLPLKRFLLDIPYWIRTHTYNRYHIINIKTKDIYEWGWIDQDHKIFLACFKCLEYFVEQEKGLNCHIDWDWDETHREVHREIQFLYDWWKKYPVLQKLNNIEWYDIEDEMLFRLLKVRRYLWT